MIARFVATLALAAVAAVEVQSQPAQTYDLPARFGNETRRELTRVIDSARAEGVPTSPLVAKSAEGVLKNADDARIVRAVRTLATELRTARTLMPADASPSILMAAASALHAGASRDALSRLAAARSASRGETDLAVALVTLADLQASRIPADAAALAVEALLRRGVSEQEYAEFRTAVGRDVAAGRPPEAALTGRLGEITRRPVSPPSSSPPRRFESPRQ